MEPARRERHRKTVVLIGVLAVVIIAAAVAAGLLLARDKGPDTARQFLEKLYTLEEPLAPPASAEEALGVQEEYAPYMTEAGLERLMLNRIPWRLSTAAGEAGVGLEPSKIRFAEISEGYYSFEVDARAEGESGGQALTFTGKLTLDEAGLVDSFDFGEDPAETLSKMN